MVGIILLHLSLLDWILIGSSTTDWATTKYAIDRGAIETNWVMPQNPYKQLAVKIPITIGLVYLSHKLDKTHPKFAKGLRIGISSFYFTVSIYNYRVGKQMTYQPLHPR